jgi:hypothetical protein
VCSPSRSVSLGLDGGYFDRGRFGLRLIDLMWQVELGIAIFRSLWCNQSGD